MKKPADEEIQKILEQDPAANGLEISSDDDFKTYKALFDALKTEPEGGLPYNFAANISRELQRRRDDAKDIKLFLWIGMVLVLGIAGVCLYSMHAYSKDIHNMAATAAPYTWIFVFSIACVLIIQYLDQKLIKSPALGDRFK